MRRSLLCTTSLTLLLGLVYSAPVLAQDDDDDEEFVEEKRVDADEFDLDDFDDAGGDDIEEFDRIEEGDEVEGELEGEEDLDDFIDDPDSGGEIRFDDELDELGDDEVGGEGVDNVGIYRAFINNMNDLGPEEEMLSWERYLKDYPNTLFRDRIDNRMEELESEVYDQRIKDPNAGYEDAKDREIKFASPMLLESLDPRTRIRVGGQMGFPSYVAGIADFEFQIMRPLSVHVGGQTRYTGGSLEFGGKYALVKSARTQTLVTGILDFHYNTNPGFLGIRPVVAAGKRFELGGGLDVQAQLGVDYELPSVGGANVTGRPGGLRYIGGINAFYQLSPIVGMFAETSLNMKHLGWDDGGTFAFDVLSFGIRFNPTSGERFKGERYEDMVQASLSTNVPIYTNYWGYHSSSVQFDTLLYLDGVGVSGKDMFGKGK